MRTNFDFAPFRRSTIGFDRLFDLLETAPRGSEASEGWPPFDLQKDGDDRYRITLAVAGFAPSEIEIVAQHNQLVVTGRKNDDKSEGTYLHRGIANRSFERRFQLADFIQVQSARFEHGLLEIALRREVPEALKPRRIEIDGAPANDRLEAPQSEQRAA
ncbi:MAG: heat-shock protein [Novosphingobium sp.]|nr:heat-shock protein [Novosphingobium sp.]